MTFQYILVFLTSLCTSVTTYAQIVEQYSFVGTIQLMDKSIITYKIEFDEMQDGSIEGKSITDFAGDHRTESEIRGRIDRREKTITFNELSNLTTKSDAQADAFCYVHLYDAKIKLKGEKSVIQGHFYSRYQDGAKCLEGDIYLVGDQYVMDKLSSITQKSIIPKDKRDMLREKMAATKENLKQTVLNEDDNLTIIAEGDNLMVRIWEAEYLDGDRVSVYLDDKIILQNYLIKASQKQLLVPVLEDTTTLRIVAENEGRLPPNSANIIILNKDTEVPIVLRLNEGKEATVVIVKKQ